MAFDSFQSATNVISKEGFTCHEIGIKIFSYDATSSVLTSTKSEPAKLPSDFLVLLSFETRQQLKYLLKSGIINGKGIKPRMECRCSKRNPVPEKNNFFNYYSKTNSVECKLRIDKLSGTNVKTAAAGEESRERKRSQTKEQEPQHLKTAVCSY